MVVLRESLAKLQTEHPGLLADVASGDRALWIGSGISRQRVPGLEKLLAKVLEFLVKHATTGSDMSAHRDALADIATTYLGYTNDQADALRDDPSKFSMPTAHQLKGLVNQYSGILSTEVAGKDSDYLLWEAVDVRHTFGSDAIEPSSEHYLVAILAHERALPGVLTTNWDGLVEKAVRELGQAGAVPPLGARVESNDFRVRGSNPPHLIKIHGCAVAAAADGKFRELLVATYPQIQRLKNEPRKYELFETAKNLVRQKPTLFLGLSVQDADLLTMLVEALGKLAWPWKLGEPAFVFAERVLDQRHKDALKVIYGAATDRPGPRDEIYRASCAGMYAEPVLGALVLHMLHTRLLEMQSEARSDSIVRNPSNAGLAKLVDYVARVTRSDYSRLVTALRFGYASALARFHGDNRSLVEESWIPLRAGGVAHVGGLDGFAVALSLIGFLTTSCRVDASTDASDQRLRGTFRLTAKPSTRSSSVRVVFVRDSPAVHALSSGQPWHLPGERPFIVLTAEDPVKTQQRGPSGTLGRGRRAATAPREIGLREILELHPGDENAAAELKRQVSL